MATLVLRLTKGSPLTTSEMDSNFTNINNELVTKLNISTYTPNDILTKLKTVDGIGSGLDANLLNGFTQTFSNVFNSIVARDGAGNFVANNITANLTGNVSGTATNVSGIVDIVNGGTGNTSGTASNVSGIIAINHGGTGATTAAAARIALGVAESGANTTISSVGAITGVTASFGNNSTLLATTKFVKDNTPPAFPSGTRLAFNQSLAPVGWTKDVSPILDDSFMRIVTGTASNGGSVAFSTFANNIATGAHTLSVGELPSHNHPLSTGPNGQVVEFSYYTGTDGTFDGSIRNTGYDRNAVGASSYMSYTGGGGSHTHPLNNNIKYNDFIICIKD